MTQGAISRQVKALEAELGIKLFNRERQRLVITEPGRGYLEVVRDAFDRLAAGTEHLLQQENAGVLTVSMSPNFAAKWLIHRLGDFIAIHPSIELRVSATMHHVDFAREELPRAAEVRSCDVLLSVTTAGFGSQRRKAGLGHPQRAAPVPPVSTVMSMLISVSRVPKSQVSR